MKNSLITVWDFLLGVILIGGAPAAVFLGLFWLFDATFQARIAPEVQLTAILAQLGVSGVCFFAAANWRQHEKNRRLPVTWLAVEIVIGLLACVGFCFYVLGITAMSHPNW